MRRDAAAKNGLRVAIYPHTNCHTDTTDTALRLAKAAAKPNVGVAFNVCHFLKQNDEADLEKTPREAAPMLTIVSINDADSGDTRKMNWNKLIQPLGEGTFDNGKLLKLLDKLGYKGPIALQCYGIKQPAKEHLAQSMKAWKSM